MREIKISKGYTAIVDDEDYERVSALGAWIASPRKHTVYAFHSLNSKATGRKTVMLHRFILGVTDGSVKVDHRDGNGLNCVRSNLRACKDSQNGQNRRKHSPAGSRYKGVYWCVKRLCWRAIITIPNHRPQRKLGVFTSEEDAARAYDAAARELYGNFAHTNFPLESIT